MSEKKYVLGIDVGTTSVKVVVYDCNEGKIVARQTKDTQANVPSELGCEGNKQNPPKILSALHACVSRLPKDYLRQIQSIGVCGQMHGVMLWHYSEDDLPWTKPDNDSSRYDVRQDKVSSLYTWQDSRCDPSFLATLPKPQSHLKAYSGYGCNTLFWTARNRPDKLQRFNCAGTIQDFVVALLCNLPKPLMSVQNAASWGYFDTKSTSWNKEVLEEAGFPVHLLPEVLSPCEVVGKLTDVWHCIPAGTPIGAAMGDLQCSVLSAIEKPDDAVMNISTSAQLAFIPSSFDPNDFDENNKVEFIPYFDGKYLAVAAALNGGNALATFVAMLQQWTLELGSHLPQSTLWTKLIESASQGSSASSLKIVPTLFGERHAPQQNASVHNIDLGNIKLGQIFRALCKGVVENLHGIMPREMLVENNIIRIHGIGSALNKNKVLQKEVEAIYQLPIVFASKGGAAWGAAVAASKMEI